MSLEDKNEDQAGSFRPVANFKALPLSGPGRWVTLYEGITLYTNDNDVLFVKGGTNPMESSLLLVAIRKLFKDGKTATQAFDLLRRGAAATAGDLSAMG